MFTLVSTAVGTLSHLGLFSDRCSAAETTEAKALFDSGAWLDQCTTAYGTVFGHELSHLFMLEPGFTNLNHGSFGTMPKAVYAQQRKYIEQMESRPDDWFRVSVLSQ